MLRKPKDPTSILRWDLRFYWSAMFIHDGLNLGQVGDG